MTAEEIRKILVAETALIGQATQTVLGGQPADISGFDARVADLCVATQGLPLDVAQSLLPDFEQLAAALDHLRAHVTERMAAAVEAGATAHP